MQNLTLAMAGSRKFFVIYKFILSSDLRSGIFQILGENFKFEILNPNYGT
ncbi:MAG TPA: hypothetical protein PKE69_12075 [Pyrinomonadaceae bacterium]|nr:hypothetical protein [Pyrinomonadaceae bacterium]